MGEPTTLLELALERAIVTPFVSGFDRRARAIRAAVGDDRDAASVLRLKAAEDLEACAAAVATLLPPDPSGTVEILPPATSASPSSIEPAGA